MNEPVTHCDGIRGDEPSRVTPRIRRIKDLPPPILKQLHDKLLKRVPSRKAAQWLAEAGYKFSHKSVNCYNQEVVQPALKIGVQLQQIQAPVNAKDASVIATAKEVKEVTQAVLAAGPLLAQKNRLMDEVFGGIEESKGEQPDLRARASLITAGRGLIETEAKLLGVGGFGAAPAGNTVVQVAVFAPIQAPALPAAEVIDAEIVDADVSELHRKP